MVDDIFQSERPNEQMNCWAAVRYSYSKAFQNAFPGMECFPWEVRRYVKRASMIH